MKTILALNIVFYTWFLTSCGGERSSNETTLITPSQPLSSPVASPKAFEQVTHEVPVEPLAFIKDKITMLITSKSLNEGRESLLKTDPEGKQLARDLHRIDITFAIGESSWAGLTTTITNKKRFPKEERSKPDLEQYKIISGELVNYIKKFDIAFRNNDKSDELGKFLFFELFYPLLQQNHAIVMIEAAKNNAELTDENWGPEQGKSTLVANFIYFPKTKVLTVVNKSDKPYQNTTEPENPVKILTTIATTHFELLTGKVSFSFKYVFGKDSKKWTLRVLP